MRARRCEIMKMEREKEMVGEDGRARRRRLRRGKKIKGERDESEKE